MIDSVDAEMWGLLGISAYVIVVAWASRRVALDMDARGKPGWFYGFTTFVLPPIGLGMWLLDRNHKGSVRSSLTRRPELGTAGDLLLFLALIATFPWGLVIWWLMARRPNPDRST